VNTDIASKRLIWRWGIYVLISVGVVFAALWTLIMVSATGMGWSGRTDLQIWFLTLFGLIPPLPLSIYLGVLANKYAKIRRSTPALLLALACCCTVPVIIYPVLWIVDR
jgi:hypothetical protein